MDSPSPHPELEQELTELRQELAELRAVQTMHHDTQVGFEAIEQQLAGIIHSAMDGIITLNDHHEIVLFNAAAEDIFQCSAQEALGKTIDQFLPASFREAHQAHIQRFAETDALSRPMGKYREVYGRRTNGEEFPLEASISKVKQQGKQWLTVILRDISQRKKDEDRLAYLGKILDESINEIYVFDETTLRFLQVNKGARENLGYSMTEMAPMTPLVIKPEFSQEEFLALLEPLRTGQREKIDFRTVHRRKDGTTYPIEAHVQLFERDTRRMFLAIILDLTKRQETEQQLQETQRTLSTLLTNLPGMVYRCRNSPEWQMEFISPSCRGLTGYHLEEFDTHQVSYRQDVIFKEDQQRVWQEIQLSLGERKPFQLSYRLQPREGPIKWVWDQGCGVYAPNGDLIGMEGYVVDISQERALEDQLRKAERLAELGTLASGMAHEIGTPMNVILGRAELLMRKTKDDRTRKGLETIVTQVERITKIMNQLLSFARKRPAERRGIDLGSVLNDVLEVLVDHLQSQHIRLNKIIPSALPKVLADPDQMNQVFLNLILNACQAMPEGGDLTISLQSNESTVECSIQDTGCGMTEEQRKRIFDPFFTTKPVGEGTGLGLTIIHGIIQEHQGTINVHSVPNEGTTFFLSLPIQHP